MSASIDEVFQPLAQKIESLSSTEVQQSPERARSVQIENFMKFLGHFCLVGGTWVVLGIISGVHLESGLLTDVQHVGEVVFSLISLGLTTETLIGFVMLVDANRHIQKSINAALKK